MDFQSVDFGQASLENNRDLNSQVQPQTHCIINSRSKNLSFLHRGNSDEDYKLRIIAPKAKNDTIKYSLSW